MLPRSTDTVLTSTGERLRSKSRDERKDSRNSDLRKEHDEMKARNQVYLPTIFLFIEVLVFITLQL